MKINKADRGLYPKMEHYLRVTFFSLPLDPVIWRNMKKYGKYSSWSELRRDTAWQGGPPFIYFHEEGANDIACSSENGSIHLFYPFGDYEGEDGVATYPSVYRYASLVPAFEPLLLAALVWLNKTGLDRLSGSGTSLMDKGGYGNCRRDYLNKFMKACGYHRADDLAATIKWFKDQVVPRFAWK